MNSFNAKEKDGSEQYRVLVHLQNTAINGGRGQWKNRQQGSCPVHAAWSTLSQDGCCTDTDSRGDPQMSPPCKFIFS